MATTSALSDGWRHQATPPIKPRRVNNSVPSDKCVYFRLFPAVCSDSNATLLWIVAGLKKSGIDCVSSSGDALIHFKDGGLARRSVTDARAPPRHKHRSDSLSLRISRSACLTPTLALTFDASAGRNRANEADEDTQHVASLLGRLLARATQGPRLGLVLASACLKCPLLCAESRRKAKRALGRRR